jgi:hypothetical protein
MQNSYAASWLYRGAATGKPFGTPVVYTTEIYALTTPCEQSQVTCMTTTTMTGSAGAQRWYSVSVFSVGLVTTDNSVFFPKRKLLAYLIFDFGEGGEGVSDVFFRDVH